MGEGGNPPTKPEVPPKVGHIKNGAIGACIFAIYQKFGLGLARPHGYTHPIQFGNLSMLLGVFCLAGLGWASTLKNTKPSFSAYLSLGLFVV